MMTDIEKARALLAQGQKTCVLCRGDALISSEKAGIAPMVEFITDEINLHGFSAADKIIGKAAALLFVLAGVHEVYADVMSTSAMEIFKQHSIPFSYGEKTTVIVNRTGTGSCPMEQAVQGLTDPRAALEAIRARQRELAKGAVNA